GHLVDAPERVDLIGARVAEQTTRRQRLDAGDPLVEGPGEVGAEELAVGDDVEPGLRQLAECELGGVTKRLLEVRGAELALRMRVPDEPEPARDRVAAERLGRKQRQAVVGQHAGGRGLPTRSYTQSGTSSGAL